MFHFFFANAVLDILFRNFLVIEPELSIFIRTVQILSDTAFFIIYVITRAFKLSFHVRSDPFDRRVTKACGSVKNTLSVKTQRTRLFTI